MMSYLPFLRNYKPKACLGVRLRRNRADQSTKRMAVQLKPGESPLSTSILAWSLTDPAEGYMAYNDIAWLFGLVNVPIMKKIPVSLNHSICRFDISFPCLDRHLVDSKIPQLTLWLVMIHIGFLNFAFLRKRFRSSSIIFGPVAESRRWEQSQPVEIGPLIKIMNRWHALCW